MKNDSLLWYNPPGWERFGLAVPNFGDDRGTQNSTILQLTQVVGRNIQNIMFHTDALVRTPPSINTIVRLCKLCVRGRSILAGRSVAANEPYMESLHAVPSYEQFIVFPTPYFTVRNTFLKEYCLLALTALTEAMQHSDNARPLEISTPFAGLIGQYIQRIYKMVGNELLQIPDKEFDDPAFTITNEHFTKYNPADWFTSTEMIDANPPETDRPTEDDLVPLTDGIPVSKLPALNRYPGGFNVTPSGTQTPSNASASFISPPSP